MATTAFKTRVRAPLACEIVNLDRVRFNDAVANGLYPCAPSTMKGSVRIFTEEDLLPLFFFARLMEFGLPAGKAGQMACGMVSAATGEASESATRIIYVHGAFTSGFFIPNKSKRPADGVVVDNYDPEHETPSEKHPNGFHYPTNGRVIFTVEFYIKHVREMLAERLAYEASILGSDASDD